MNLTDWRGTPIEAGSTIVYPGRHSSQLWMNEGVVVEINSVTKWSATLTELKVQRTRDRWNSAITARAFVTLTALDNVTVV